MNLSSDWVPLLQSAGYDALHWVNVGKASSPDVEIMAWAREHQYVVFTHDLDFGALLHATGAVAPSVIQFRVNDLRPASLVEKALLALERAKQEIMDGALVTVDTGRLRISCLPLKKV